MSNGLPVDFVCMMEDEDSGQANSTLSFDCSVLLQCATPVTITIQFYLFICFRGHLFSHWSHVAERNFTQATADCSLSSISPPRQHQAAVSQSKTKTANIPIVLQKEQQLFCEKEAKDHWMCPSYYMVALGTGTDQKPAEVHGRTATPSHIYWPTTVRVNGPDAGFPFISC